MTSASFRDEKGIVGKFRRLRHARNRIPPGPEH